MHSAQKLACWGSAGLLLFGTAVIVFGELAAANPLPRVPLRRLLAGAGNAAGWSCEFRPLAETPEGARVVANILAYDDAAFGLYVNGTMRVAVYAAYWRPGKISPRAVARHTPDRCWVLSGWECTRRITNRGIVAQNGKAVLPAEERAMQIGGQRENILYWHVVGGKVVSYGSEIPPWHAAMSDLWRLGLRQREEQFFIRLSSQSPLNQWLTSDLMQALFSRLPLMAD